MRGGEHPLVGGSDSYTLTGRETHRVVKEGRDCLVKRVGARRKSAGDCKVNPWPVGRDWRMDLRGARRSSSSCSVSPLSRGAGTPPPIFWGVALD